MLKTSPERRIDPLLSRGPHPLQHVDAFLLGFLQSQGPAPD
jgi:hypothetical protein